MNPSLSEARARVAVALDVATLREATAFVRDVREHVGVAKVGLELFVKYGPEAVRAVRAEGMPEVFLDLKLCDIPETVRRAVAAARELGVAFLTVHAAGGARMLRAAQEEAGEDLKVLAVTVLTSMGADDLAELGVSVAPAAQADRLMALAWEAGVRGFVCSPLEAAALRARREGALLVTPGVRPAGSEAGDQTRIATPREAIRAGADLLVVGRPLRDAPDRAAAARALVAEVAEALA